MDLVYHNNLRLSLQLNCEMISTEDSIVLILYSVWNRML